MNEEEESLNVGLNIEKQPSGDVCLVDVFIKNTVFVAL